MNLLLSPQSFLFANAILTALIAFAFSILVLFNVRGHSGVSYWVLGFVLIALGQLSLLFQSILPEPLVIILFSVLVFWGYVEIKRGISFFLDRKSRFVLDIIVLALMLLAISLFSENSSLLSLVLSLALIILCIDMAVIFVQSRKDNDSSPKEFRLKMFFVSGIVLSLIVRISLVAAIGSGTSAETLNVILSLASVFLGIAHLFLFFLVLQLLIQRLQRHKLRLIKELEETKITDPVSGVMNRSGFMDTLDYELKKNTRNQKGLSLVIGSIDDFRSVNNDYGQEFGDHLLLYVSKVIRTAIRETDTLARWGTHEFILLFPETNSDELKVPLERIRLTMEKEKIKFKGKKFHRTMSFGGHYSDRVKIDRNELITLVDQNLSVSKKQGHNQITLS